MQGLGSAKLAIDHAKSASVVLNAGGVESLIDRSIVRNEISVSLRALILCVGPANVLILGIEVGVPALLTMLVIDRVGPSDNLLFGRVVVEDLLWLLLRLNHRFDLVDDVVIDVGHRARLFFADVVLFLLFDTSRGLL